MRANAAARLEEAPRLRERIEAAPGTATAAKAAKVADRAAIDLVDGKLDVVIRELDVAGRKAIRNGDLRASLHDYRFRHLYRSGPAGAPVETAAGPPPPPPGGTPG